jgi:tetratricopeptide (TPR) repeat protein
MESIIGDWPVADKTVLAGLAVSVYPRSVPAWISYAECLKQNGAQAQFQAALGRAAGLGAGPRQRRLLADAYIAASDFRRALEQLDGLPGPEDVDLLIEKARARAGLGQKESALSALSQAASLAPSPSQRRLLADAFSGAGDFRRALEQLDALPGPEDVDSLLEKARARAGLGQKGSALSALYKAASLGPSPSQRRRLADAFSGADDLKSALEQFEALPEPEDVDALVGKARALAGLGRKASAASVLSRAQTMVSDPEQKYKIALLYQDIAHHQQALAILAELTKARPRNMEFLVSRGVSEYMGGSPDRAMVDLKKAIQLSPNDLPAYVSLGFIYEEQGRYRQAVELYESALLNSRAQPADSIRQAVAEGLERTKAKVRSLKAWRAGTFVPRKTSN